MIFEDLALWQILATAFITLAYVLYKYQILEKEKYLQYVEQSQVLEHIHNSIIITDTKGYIKSWNTGSQNLLGFSSQEMISQHITKIYKQEEYDELLENIDTVNEVGEYNTEINLLKKSEDRVQTSLSLSLIRDSKGKHSGYVAYSTDITERKKMENELYIQKDILSHLAHHDSLTGLPNRMLFHDRFEQAIIKAERNKSILALLFIDLDKFKPINDSLGHEVGDKVLELVSHRLGSTVRREDTLARFGGDEFTIIMQDLSEKKDAGILAKKIIEALKEPMLINNQSLNISSSIGISFYPHDDISSHKLVHNADMAMYKAKKSRRDNFKYFCDNVDKKELEVVNL